jgi:hypothetical protein
MRHNYSNLPSHRAESSIKAGITPAFHGFDWGSMLT